MLSKRLQAIIELVDPNDVIADIGCDHGLVAIALSKRYKTMNVYASDISKQPLTVAQQNIAKHNLEKNITLVLGAGLKWIKPADKINCIIIAGLGTNTILEILSDDNKAINRYIIQTNNDGYKIRQWAFEHNYFIEKEQLILENDYYYEIIVINKKQGKQLQTKEQLMFGIDLVKNDYHLFNKYWKQRYVYYKELADKLRTQKINSDIENKVTLIKNKLQP